MLENENKELAPRQCPALLHWDRLEWLADKSDVTTMTFILLYDHTDKLWITIEKLFYSLQVLVFSRKLMHWSGR